MDVSQAMPGGWEAARGLLITGLLIALNGFFVAAEFALVKVRGTRVAELADEGLFRARVVQSILGHLDSYLAACQLGITIASVLLGYVAEPYVAGLLLRGAAALGVPVEPGAGLVHGIALVVALALITLALMILGEQSPKLYAIRNAERTALFLALPLRMVYHALRPLTAMVSALSDAILALLGIRPADARASSHSAEELRAILETSARAGHISAQEREFTQNILGLMELQVRHILVPRVDAVFLSLQYDYDRNIEIVRRSGHSRFPLCKEGLDTVVGIVHSKEVMSALLDGKRVDLEALARPAVFVPDTQPLSRLIVQLQQSQNHCVVAVDEHGTSIGLVFLEDALEEIVGPIRDEFDVEIPAVREVAPGVLEVPGDLPLPEAASVLGLDLEDESSDTIAGHVVSQLGRLPRRGDQIELGAYRVTIAEITRRRIGRLRFERRLPPEPD
jgi:CBS domain containing-hemolysin-like protein